MATAGIEGAFNTGGVQDPELGCITQPSSSLVFTDLCFNTLLGFGGYGNQLTVNFAGSITSSGNYTITGNGTYGLPGAPQSNPISDGEIAISVYWCTARSGGDICPSGPLEVTTTSLPNATSGQSYGQQLYAQGGSGTGYTWSLAGGALPAGFTLTPLGMITSTGNPAAVPKSYSFTVQVKDSAGAVASQPLMLLVKGSPPLSISTALSLPNDTPGIAYSIQLSATGGSGTYQWSAGDGFPNSWFTLSSSGKMSVDTISFQQTIATPLENIFVIPDPDVYTFPITVNDGFTTKTATFSLQVTCSNSEKDDLINQYEQYDTAGNAQVRYRAASLWVIPFPDAPSCGDFTQTAHSSTFNFAELTSGSGGSWAIIRSAMVAPSGLDLWVFDYTGIGGRRVINSAYRTPAHNASITGASPVSRHVFGDAVDLRNITYTQAEWNAMKTAAQKARVSWIEPLSGPCHLGCVHSDWRKVIGGYAQ